MFCYFSVLGYVTWMPPNIFLKPGIHEFEVMELAALPMVLAMTWKPLVCPKARPKKDPNANTRMSTIPFIFDPPLKATEPYVS